MMRTRTALAALMIGASSVVLTGCGSTSLAGGGATGDGGGGDSCAGFALPSQVRSVVLIAPVHRGTRAAQVPVAWQCTLQSALNHKVPVSVVTAEGTPQVVLRDYTAPISNVNPYAHQDDLVAAQNQIISAYRTARASSDGNDLWAALTTAADLGASDGGRVDVLSQDNGLTDRGALTMSSRGMSDAAPTDVVAYVRRTNSCGLLRNTDIELDGIGYGISPQPALPQQQRDKITTLWLKALAGCGAHATAKPVPPESTDPPITTSYTTKPVPVQTIPAFTISNKPIVMPDASPLGFAPDTAIFRDPDAARNSLAGLARQLRKEPKVVVTVTGSTAFGTTRWPSLKALGQARADACKNLLVKLGVPAGHIRAISVGYQSDPPGNTPAAAALNRKVTFTFTTE